jgi:hypothetical protein
VKLTDEDLEALEDYGEDVRAAVRELRALREQVATLTDVVDRQVVYIKELRAQLKIAPHDFEPARPGISDVD